MDDSWEKWLSDLLLQEMDDRHLFSECHMNSLEGVFDGENSLQPAVSWESHSSDSTFTAETTSVLTVAAATTAKGNSWSEEITGFDNSLKQHASEKPVFSSSMSYTLSFEDSTAVPNIPKKSRQNHGTQSKETQDDSIHKSRDNRKSKNGRSSSQTQEHIIAERRRRENLTRLFVALSATLPGLKKMDKASVLKDAINYVKHLQKRVIELEELNKKRKIESVVYFNNNKSNVAVVDDFSCSTFGCDRPIKTFPNVEASVSAKDVRIRVTCEKQKDNIVPKLLAKLEANNLSIASSSVLPFGNSTQDITIIAQMDSEFSMTMDDLVKILNKDLLECCNVQQ